MSSKHQHQQTINNSSGSYLPTTSIASSYDENDSSETDPLQQTHPLQYNELQQLKNHTFGYKTLTSKRNLFLFYIFLIFIYIGINLGLLFANFKSQEFIEENYFMGLHAVEFWAVFVFSALEGLVLISTNNLQAIWQMGLILFNITFAFSTALLFQLHPPSYETVAHYMEYSCQITITLVNFLFIWSQLNPTNIKQSKYNNKDVENQSTELIPQPTSNQDPNHPQVIFYKYRYVEFTAAAVVFIASILQLFIFSETIKTNLDSSERAAHFLEFSIEAANGLFASFFAIVTFNYYNSRVKYHADHINKAKNCDPDLYY